MNLTVAVIGETWEAAFVRVTLRSLPEWLPQDAQVCVLSEFKHCLDDHFPRSVRFVDATKPGFQTYEAMRERVLRVTDEGVLLLAAGALPVGTKPLEYLGASQTRERVFEWHALTENAAASVLHFQQPPHSPPAHPHHTVKRVGALDFWTIDGECNYFQGLTHLQQGDASPVWTQYGSHRPVFVYNTNEFNEPPIAAHDEYCILGSGLFGLRMVAESRPDRGARVVIYDINPDQLLWIKFVLEVCAEIAELEEVIEQFRAKHPSVTIRSVLAHERENASRQGDWYRQHSQQLHQLRSKLRWEFVECDLWNEPAVLLNRLNPTGSLFFMYLDLFVVWHTDNEPPWVEDHIGAARSLEGLIRARTRGTVTFLPGPDSTRFQLHPESPFAGGKDSPSCT
ncbi:MAG TPA: hypothetical protein VF088_00010 [Pyrinomonadaceae bacterium]